MPAVTSEIGRLRTVLLHRPGIELARLTPQNTQALLFDDILWLERAQEEHDRFADLLRGHGAEVLYVRDLLAETLHDDAVRAALIDRVVTPAITGRRVAEHLRGELRDCEMDRLLDVLFGGVLRSELPAWGIDPVFAGLASDSHRAVIKPLPNMMFMRDNAAWLQSGLMFGVLAWPARRPESLIMSTVYRHHPRFTDAGFPVWYGDREFDTYPASIEGGDVLVIDERTVLIGSGERTAPAAAEALARRLFELGAVDRVIVAHFPEERSFMHLDTVFTMIDHDALNVFPHVLDDMEVYRVTPGPNGSLDVEPEPGLVAALEAALGRSLRVVTTGDDAVGSMREQWDDGNNTLAVAPGVVIAYARNSETNRRLREHGIEVLELDASELCRGRGGSRCLTQPIDREPV
jgi:arginine deiminase